MSGPGPRASCNRYYWMASVGLLPRSLHSDFSCHYVPYFGDYWRQIDEMRDDVAANGWQEDHSTRFAAVYRSMRLHKAKIEGLQALGEYGEYEICVRPD